MRGAALMLALCLALGSLPADAKPQVRASSLELDRAWGRYLSQEVGLEPASVFPYEDCFRRSAETHGLPLTLLLAVARGESDFDPTARSRANAYGLMQILWPGTARHLGIHRRAKLLEPCTNVDAGTRYLKELLTRYGGNLHLALAAYNYGPSRIPDDPRGIPDGARWYSGYIYRHLRYVLRDARPQGETGPRQEYASVVKEPVISFNVPYRADAFVDRLRKTMPTLRLDWFRVAAGVYQVYALYRGASEREAGRRALLRLGFTRGGGG